MRPLPYDVQRDLPFYRTLVAFRIAVERMQLRHGTLRDADHVFWGFGTPERWFDPGPDDGDWLTPSGVPRRPWPSAGGASVAAEEIDSEAAERTDALVAEWPSRT